MIKARPRHIRAISYLLTFLLVAIGGRATAQNKDTATVPVHVVQVATVTFYKTDSGDFQHLNGNVILQQGTDSLYCDSAVMNQGTKNFEGFGHVRIAQQGGTHGTSDYLKYTSAARQAFMSGNVEMTDGKNNLDCEELTYNLGTKIAVYDKWGRLYNDSTTVTSRTGEYNIQQKEARFKGKVVIADTQYHIVSEDVMYNTDTKITVFYAHSIVTRDSGRSVLETSDGWYDGKLGIAHFKGLSKIWNDGEYIEGLAIDYNRQTGHGIADSDVILVDTAHHSTMYCGHIEYFQKQRKMWATIKPVLVQANGKDTLYIRADSFYSAPMVRSRVPLKPLNDSLTLRIDSLKKIIADPMVDSALKNKLADLIPRRDTAYEQQKPVISTQFHVPLSKDDTGDAPAVKQVKQLKQAPKAKASKKKNKKSDLPIVVTNMADTAIADTTAPLYFIGYHHVLIFSDSLQGKCDSICYTRADSLIRMMYNPIAWSHKSQITGDTILMQLDSTTMRKMYVPNNALIVSQSGPVKAALWDQIQGRTLTAYFDSNAIKKMIVKPEAESIYYNKDDKGAYLGVSQSSSTRMFVYFNDQKIKDILLEKDASMTMTPLDKADLPNTKLSRFKWLDDQRPLSKEELFR